MISNGIDCMKIPILYVNSTEKNWLTEKQKKVKKRFTRTKNFAFKHQVLDLVPFAGVVVIIMNFSDHFMPFKNDYKPILMTVTLVTLPAIIAF